MSSLRRTTVVAVAVHPYTARARAHLSVASSNQHNHE